MMKTFNVLCIILVTFATTVVQSQECKKIQHTTVIDANLRNSMLDCAVDKHHEIRIFKAEYRILKADNYLLSNDEDLNRSCFIRGMSEEIKHKCHKKKTCLFDQEDFDTYARDSLPTYPYACDDYHGVKYLMVTWQCRAKLNQEYKAYAIDLNDNRPHEISFAVVDSHDLWRWTLDICHDLLNPHCTLSEDFVKDNVLITEHDKGCSFVVPPNTELWVRAHEIYKFAPNDDPSYIPSTCEQKIQVYNSVQRWELCEMGDFFQVPCQDQEQTYYFKFETQNPKMRVGFAIYFEVDYEMPTMKSTCGIPVNQLPAVPSVEASSAHTTTTTTTIAPVRTTPPTTPYPTRAPSSSFSFADIPTWIIVLLAAIVATIIMLIVISIVCLRHCCVGAAGRDDEDKIAQTESEWGSEVSTVYVEGDRSSKLVVSSLKASSRSQGELVFPY